MEEKNPWKTSYELHTKVVTLIQLSFNHTFSQVEAIEQL